MEYTGGSDKATHLCVLVHGLWGNPSHMKAIAQYLREQHSPDELYLVLAKSNSGSFTYDGIERGGERVCAEIEEELQTLGKSGNTFNKFSVVGYSLGGLVARYAVGLLHAKGVLDDLECMNFTTFASPHLGVRSPLKGWHNDIWNVMGARTLSMSGRQLFLIDEFRDTGRPLLAVLADPKSIFMCGLRQFKRHTLYANIVNDKSVVYYTSCIQRTDPFTDPSNLEINFLEGCDSTILDPDKPFEPRSDLDRSLTVSTVSASISKWSKRIPLAAALTLLLPVGVVAFLINSVVQTVRSSSRIELHESGGAGLKVEEYRMSLWMREIREEVEHVYETLNNTQNQEHLGPPDSESKTALETGTVNAEPQDIMTRERRMSLSSQPTLALAPSQFEMIDSLDAIGWRKYPVWIHNHRHSHAAIIVRIDKPSFDEGRVVLKHFAKQEFLT